ncbi:MAG: TOPRIM nucleotidyl transferase/hydrolase domain-containing protein [Planctomycetota bacterium]
MRPQSIRTVERINRNGEPKSKIRNEAYSENLASVRSLIGLTPSDSLLFAPCVIVTEGKTERICLPKLIRLYLEHESRMDQLDSFLSQVAVLDGEGDSFKQAVRTVLSQRASPVIFLDGDKTQLKDSLSKEFPKVPAVFLPNRQELEDLVPNHKYFESAVKRSQQVEPDGRDPSFEDFCNWRDTSENGKKMLLSKQVDYFLVRECGFTMDAKHRVLSDAIDACSNDELDFSPIKHLYEKVNAVLSMD